MCGVFGRGESEATCRLWLDRAETRHEPESRYSGEDYCDHDDGGKPNALAGETLGEHGGADEGDDACGQDRSKAGEPRERALPAQPRGAGTTPKPRPVESPPNRG